MASLFAMGKYLPGQKSEKNELVDDYFKDYKAHKESYPHKPESRRTVKQELDWLASLQPIEGASVQRFVDHRVFQGLTLETIDGHARDDVASSKVELSAGWKKLLLSSSASGDAQLEVSIVTVNWCAQFIRSVLLQSLKNDIEDASNDESNQLAGITIYGNAFGKEAQTKGDGNQRSSTSAVMDGSIVPTHLTGIHVAQDKVDIIRAIRIADAAKDPDSKWLSIYVGDSSTDLAALISGQIDVGIYMRPVTDDQSTSLPPETDLSRTLERIGIRKERSVADFGMDWRVLRDEDGFAREVLWARDLGEIEEHVIAKLRTGKEILRREQSSQVVYN